MNVIWIKEGNFPHLNEKICCAIGNFDGVHLGHQQLINETKKHGLKSAVLTFYPHPFTVLKQMKPYRQLTPIAHKIDIIESFGVDYLFIVEFDNETANMKKEDFMRNLHILGIESVVCGYDFTFAEKALGTTKDLASEFTVYEIAKYQLSNVRVSTTYIKELVASGGVDLAKDMLGRPFTIVGKVVSGKHIGTKLGFPTANIDYDIYFLPKNGVYATRVIYKDVVYYAMTNVGINPTIDFSLDVKVEVHILDFDQDIYGENLKILFDKRIRPEKKFNNKEELVRQLTLDREVIKDFYKKEEIL